MKLAVITRSLLLGQTRLGTTPRPFRKAKPSEREHLRGIFDAEFWDNFTGQVFSLNGGAAQVVAQGATFDYGPISVPMPIAGRITAAGAVQITTTVATVAADATATYLVDGVETPSIGSPLGRWHVPVIAGLFIITMPLDNFFDVAVGAHTVGIRVKNNSAAGGATVTFSSLRFTARRGKKPPP